MDVNKTGEFLAALRKSQGYTQQEVADHLNISNKTISKWEQGKGYPDLTMLPVLAEFYRVTVDEILAGEKMNRQTEPDRQRGTELRRRLVGRMELHVDLCMLGVFLSVLLAGIFAYSMGCFLLSILAAGILLAGILVLNYELKSAEGTLEEAERGKVCRTAGQKTFLAMGLILLSSLFTPYLTVPYRYYPDEDVLERAVLWAHLWAAVCTAGMIGLWDFIQKRWGTFLDRTSAILCGAGLILLNVFAAVKGYWEEYISLWLEAMGSPHSWRLAHRMIVLCLFMGVGLIAVGVVRQLRQERRR